MPLIEEETSFKTRDAELRAFLARPEGAGKFPGVIVIHEILGLNENIRSISRRFADNGYVALAVDLFSAGNTAICIAQTMADVFNADTNVVGTRRLISALDFLSLQSFVDASRIGAIGFCLGGNFAIKLACEDKRLKTIAPFYSRNPGFQKINQLCPVVGSYPSLDITAAEGRKLQAKLDECGVENDIKIYPNATHSFMSKELPFTSDEDAAKDSWDRTLSFFSKYLKREAT